MEVMAIKKALSYWWNPTMEYPESGTFSSLKASLCASKNWKHQIPEGRSGGQSNFPVQKSWQENLKPKISGIEWIPLEY